MHLAVETVGPTLLWLFKPAWGWSSFTPGRIETNLHEELCDAPEIRQLEAINSLFYDPLIASGMYITVTC